MNKSEKALNDLSDIVYKIGGTNIKTLKTYKIIKEGIKMRTIQVGSLVKILSTEEELLKQGLTLKALLKRYPKRFAIVHDIYQRTMFSNDIRSIGLDKGFYIAEDQLEDTGTIVYRTDKEISDLFDRLDKEIKDQESQDLTREVMQ